MKQSDNAKLWMVRNEYLRWLDLMTEDRDIAARQGRKPGKCRLLETNLFAMRREEVAELKQWIYDIGVALEIEGSSLPFNHHRGKEPI
jgi:hypothetical protein